MNGWAFPISAACVIAAGLAAGWVLDRIFDRVYGTRKPPAASTPRGAHHDPTGGRSAGHSR